MKTKEYYELIESGVLKEFEIAKQARSKGLDYAEVPETYIAKDIADKVEGLVELKGISVIIRQLQKQYKSDEEVAFKLADYIIAEELQQTGNRELAAEKAIRAGLAYLTQGAVSAPIEGIAKLRIKKNPDGSEYLSVYYSGPIRAAGGTAEALSIIVADYVRKVLGLGKYQPTLPEIGRCAEEILWYKRNVHLQYMPSKEEIETIVRNVPVCIDGEPTEEFEVVTYRDLGRVETNRVRGGMCLVIAEGIAQKASKLVKKLRPLEQKYGLDWGWLDGLLVKKAAKEIPYAHERLEAIIEGASTEEYSWLQDFDVEDVSVIGKFVDVTKEAEEFLDEITASAGETGGSEKFMQEVPAGRPVFSNPSRKGGFMLRYGRTRATGYSAVAISPATMYILGEFIAIGTQLRLELPGKAGIVTGCDTINGPTVVLDDEELRQINTLDEAKNLRSRVKKIISLGDILISAGDFMENNHKLHPSAYVEEWWAQEVKKSMLDKQIEDKRYTAYLNKPFPTPTFQEALQISKKYNIPLHPKYTFFWNDITIEQFKKLLNSLSEKTFRENSELTYEKGLKKILEVLCVFHKVSKGKIVLDKEHGLALLTTLSLEENNPGKILQQLNNDDSNESIIDFLNKISTVKIKNRAPTCVGARMGRPEKAKPRKMVPPPHTLFPTGAVKGRVRDLIKAASISPISKPEIAKFKCTNCKSEEIFPFCRKCKSRTVLMNFCSNCGRESEKQKCPACNIEMHAYSRRAVNLKEEIDQASLNVGVKNLDKLVGVIGMTSKDKIPEPIEKGILRAKNNVYVFKDGTIRFDATDAPLTHFKPKEINVPVKKLIELGYTHDTENKPLTDAEQLLELKPQDLVISDYGGEESCANYLINATKFIDELLERFYKLPPFYNAKKKQDLVGQLVVALAPHTSTGIIGRILGFTNAKVCFANPAFHDAKRRDCDGDEDSIILLLDVFLNFSRSFIPEKRGGRMDAPLVISTILNPLEIDAEVYDVDIVPEYPLSFYELTEQGADSSKAQIKTFRDIVNAPDPFNGWSFTHDVDNLNEAPISNIYTEGAMLDKLRKQLELAEIIRAVDVKEVAGKIIDTHFIPDMKGNLRTFSRQKIRCTKCNSKYRRPPISGNCVRCGGNLTLTVHKGTIEKYLKATKEMIIKYNIPAYTKQQVDLIEKSLISIFGVEKQKTLDVFKQKA